MDGSMDGLDWMWLSYKWLSSNWTVIVSRVYENKSCSDLLLRVTKYGISCIHAHEQNFIVSGEEEGEEEEEE